MHTHNATLYPMLGVGAFMVMFWTGIVVGHELGLECASLLISGLLSACIGTVGVCELQKRDAHGAATIRARRVPQSGRSARAGGVAAEPAPKAAAGRRPCSAGIGGRLPIGS